MKFNLKLFVLVGVLAGFRDVWGTEEKDENKDYDGFIVSKELLEFEGFEDAMKGNRVIKAVYKTGDGGEEVPIIYGNFKEQLSYILVWDGKEGKKVEVEKLYNDGDDIFYHMKQNVEYTVYFIFKNELLNSTASMFYWCERLIHADFRYFNTSNVTDMSYMFCGCTALTKLDLSPFSTTNVTVMSCMFSDCTALTKLDLSSFNTINVTSMSFMFSNCSHLTELDLSNFKTQSVQIMYCMFSGCIALTKLDLSSFDTKNVTRMASMFSKCTSLKELNLSSFDTTNVTDMFGMFSKCQSLKELNLSKFNTKNVIDMSRMFYNCKSLKKLDLRNFYFSPVCKMNDIFQGCNFGNLCLPQTYAKTRRRCWCCSDRYVYLQGNVFGFLNQNNVEFVEDVQYDLIGS